MSSSIFDGMNDIDWSRLEHAYGPATDVPKLLTRVASDDFNRSSDALTELFGTIWHHGAVYSATAKAAPFLLEIVRVGHCPRLDEVVWLLGKIAYGTGYWQTQHLRFKSDKPKFSPAQLDAQLKREAEICAACVAAVREGTATFLKLLEHRDEQLRIASSYALSALVDDEQVKRGLNAAISKERDPHVGAALGLALARAGLFVEQAFLQTPKPIVLFARRAAAEPELRERLPELIERLADPSDDLAAELAAELAASP